MTRAKNKTTVTAVTPSDFIRSLEHPQRQADAKTLLTFFRRVTGWKPKMWGSSIVGFGSYHYRYESGREGDMLVTGFSPRKASLVLYIMPGYQDLGEKLQRLGKHRIGKSCLYIKRLDDVDMTVLEEIVQQGVAHIRANYSAGP